MGSEYTPAKDMFITSGAWVFTDALKDIPHSDLSIVIHKTACNGKCSAESVADFFHNDTTGHKSVHFIVGLDGEVVQVVHLKDGAGGNCCLESGHDTYWDKYKSKYGNLNRCTISIEHVDQTVDNSQAMPQAQVTASFKLVHFLCDKFSIPPSHIKGHNTLDPLSRKDCPGSTYPMQKLLQSFHEGAPPPAPNPFFVQEALACWQACISDVDATTFIFETWAKAWEKDNKQYGPAISHEYKTVNKSGTSIIAQECAHARAEFDGKVVKWYSYTGGA